MQSDTEAKIVSLLLTREAEDALKEKKRARPKLRELAELLQHHAEPLSKILAKMKDAGVLACVGQGWEVSRAWLVESLLLHIVEEKRSRCSHPSVKGAEGGRVECAICGVRLR